MQQADKANLTDLDGEGLSIGIVRARFNDPITRALEAACRDELRQLGVHDEDIRSVSVPGALEVPLALDAMARSGDFDALVALGCVIRGETYHFELVSDQSGAGVMRVSLDHRVAVANAILTVDTEQQARARIDEKGRDAARVAVEMALLLEELT
jgi:6,7-dimethyl-8-ribityllumazine synthase